MRIKKTAGMSVLSLGVATISCFGMSGLAAADSITTTGPGSYNVIENNSDSYGGYGGYYSAPTSDNWSTLNPTTWQSQGRSFSSWWEAVTANMPEYNSSCFSHGSMNYASSWMPTGNNWQASWSNWDPYLWMSNGQNFSNWHSQLMSYLSGQYSQYMTNWSGSDQPAVPQTSANSISVTGPGSVNAITTSANYGSNSQAVNENNVTTSNTNNQSAVSGNASSNGNTIGGNVSSGNAYNQNENQTSVDVSNATPTYSGFNGGSGYSEPESIGLTGPGSHNTITTSYDEDYGEYNSDNINASNSNSQYARSGDASSNGNTIGGNVSSGNAYNSNGNYAGVDVSNQ